MTSLIAWLDASSEEQRQIRDIIRLFADTDSRDELGIGQVRDAVDDALFPGSSSLHASDTSPKNTTRPALFTVRIVPNSWLSNTWIVVSMIGTLWRAEMSDAELRAQLSEGMPRTREESTHLRDPSQNAKKCIWPICPRWVPHPSSPEELRGIEPPGLERLEDSKGVDHLEAV